MSNATYEEIRKAAEAYFNAPMSDEEALTHAAECKFFSRGYADRQFRMRRQSHRPAILKDNFAAAAKAARQAGYDVEY